MIALCTLLLLGESARPLPHPHPAAAGWPLPCPRRSVQCGRLLSSSSAAAAVTGGNCVSAATAGEIPLAAVRAVHRRQTAATAAEVEGEADIALVNSGGLGTD